MNKHFLQGTLFLLALALTGCVNFKPVPGSAANTFTIDSTYIPVKSASTKWSLLVTTPKAAPGFTDQRMMYVQQAHELKYFVKNRWVDSPANILQPLIVQALQNSGRFQAVVSSPYFGDTDLRLDTEILTLQQEFLQKPSQVHLVVRAQLINMQTRRVMATDVFDLLQASSADDPYAGVQAANQATLTLLKKLVEFSVNNTETVAVKESAVAKTAKP